MAIEFTENDEVRTYTDNFSGVSIKNTSVQVVASGLHKTKLHGQRLTEC